MSAVINRGKYYKFILNQLQEMKHISYSKDTLMRMLIATAARYNITDIDISQFGIDLTFVLMDLGFLDEE